MLSTYDDLPVHSSAHPVASPMVASTGAVERYTFAGGDGSGAVVAVGPHTPGRLTGFTEGAPA